MKKTLTLIAFVLLTGIIARAQTGWVAYTADKHISLKFPSQPGQLTPGTTGVMTKDSVILGITVIDLGKAVGLDSTTLASLKENPEFAEQMRMGMQQSKKDVDLQPFKVGTWQGLTSYTSGGMAPGNKQFKLFMVIYGATIYNLTTVTLPKSDVKIAEDFFKTLTFTK